MSQSQFTVAFHESSRLLRCLIRIVGLGLLCAAVPVFFPIAWMAAIHAWLGLGEFPDQAITEYLARSTSLLYAIHGFLMVWISIKWHQNWNLVPVLGVLHVVIGVVMLGVDIRAGMPRYWTWFEGPPVALTGIAILWLFNRVQRDNLSVSSKQV